MESCLDFMQHIEMDASIFLCAQGLQSEESDLPEKVSKRKCLNALINTLINHFQCSVPFFFYASKFYVLIMLQCSEAYMSFVSCFQMGVSLIFHNNLGSGHATES